MSEKTDLFIKTVAPVAQAIYKQRLSVKPSVCIAQAALESGWNVNAKTLFGIKGAGYTAKTQEFINGQYVTIEASFKSYPDLTSAVVGYYDLMDKARYAGSHNLATPEEQIKYIWTAGYATDPHYVEKIIAIINNYNLKRFDNVVELKSNDEIADEVINGRWGNGQERKDRLTQAGYNYSAIQSIVNAKCASQTTRKSYDEIAREVINGRWGNGQERKDKLAAAGYNYSEVQSIVNKLLS